MWRQAVTCFAALSNIVASYVISPRERGLAATATVIPTELVKRGGDPADFTWIKRWAAIGDSYTAGIGAGAPLGRIFTDKLEIKLPDGTISGHDDWYCARYNRAYPKVIQAQFGSHVEDFQYYACSGDRSEQIFQQAQHLKGDLDYVVMTAGGNDLCLAKMIKDCIFVPYFKRDACDIVIKKAEDNINTILKDNVRQILKELNGKVKKDGIVILNAYAQFFNADNADCEHESWDTFWMIPFRKLSFETLTKARRVQFNNLVLGINRVLGELADEIAADKSIGYKIGFAQWDQFVIDIDGQMCSPSSKGDYPDPNQPYMQFIKPDTYPWFGWAEDVKTELRRREVKSIDDLEPEEKRTYLHWETEMKRRAKVFEDSIYDSTLYKSVSLGAEALHRLDKRAPQPPNCPGDGDKDWSFGLGMPDSIGRNFHPNINGHLTIASFALEQTMDVRALVLNQAPYCPIKSQRTCNSAFKGQHPYTQADRLDISYKDFCEKFVPANIPEHSVNWRLYKSYDDNTPEMHQLSITLGNKLAVYDKQKCLDSFRSLIHDCDTNSKMNWKMGGKYVVDGGDYTFEASPQMERPWPPPDSPVGRCEGWYKGAWSEYTLEGGGWSTWDYGQKTLRPNMDSCYGYGTGFWKFDYYDTPTKEGYEWKATFTTPIWVRARCFKNNKIAFAAGGFTNGCGGNDA